MIVLVVFIVLIGVIFSLPKQKQYTDKILVNCTPTAATRVMSDLKNWKLWWPGEIQEDSLFSFKHQPIQIQTILLNGFYANISLQDIPAFIDIQFLSAPNKQSEFSYTYTFYYSKNPLIKLVQLFKIGTAKAELDLLLNGIKSNLEDVKKVYGFEIIEERVPNATHISTKKEFNHYPNTEEIYRSVDALYNYISENQAKAVNAPIYNIFTPDDKHYQLMVAIATDRPLPTNNTFLFKEMVRGKIIVGKSIGPNNTIDQCLKQVEYFVKDHGRSSPAIQFNRLITDRRKEKDSTKWITTINYPVFDRSFF
ncbi:MAG: hypothetical protein RI965_1388 [Bacteroidota bacterium]|jgi:hypothetical protein